MEKPKNLMCMTHGHDLRAKIAGRKGLLGRGGQREENWDKCYSIINNIKNNPNVS